MLRCWGLDRQIGSACIKVLAHSSVEDCVNEGLMKTTGITSPITAVGSCSPAESNGTAIAPLESVKAYNCWRGGGRNWGGGCEKGRGEGLR